MESRPRPRLQAALAVVLAVALTAVCFYAFTNVLVLVLRPWLQPAAAPAGEAPLVARLALVAVYTVPALLAPLAGVWFSAGCFVRVPVRVVLLGLLAVVALGFVAGLLAGAASAGVVAIVSALHAVGAVLGATLAQRTRERALPGPPSED